MRELVINNGRDLGETGRRGENLVTCVSFNLSVFIRNYGEGTVVLMVKRPKDSTAYPVEVERKGNLAVWTLTATDTRYAGEGECELFWYVGEQLKKSVIYRFWIGRDVGDVSVAPPEPYESWVETITRLGAETQANAEAAEAARDAAEAARTQISALFPPVGNAGDKLTVGANGVPEWASDVFVVTLTPDDETYENLTADYTLDEIMDAKDAGKRVVAAVDFGGASYYAELADSMKVRFSGNVYISLSFGIVYPTTSGNMAYMVLYAYDKRGHTNKFVGKVTAFIPGHDGAGHTGDVLTLNTNNIVWAPPPMNAVNVTCTLNQSAGTVTNVSATVAEISALFAAEKWIYLTTYDANGNLLSGAWTPSRFTTTSGNEHFRWVHIIIRNGQCVIQTIKYQNGAWGYEEQATTALPEQSVYTVTLTYNSSTGKFESDQTMSEIWEAKAAGKRVVGQQSISPGVNMYYELVNSVDNREGVTRYFCYEFICYNFGWGQTVGNDTISLMSAYYKAGDSREFDYKTYALIPVYSNVADGSVLTVRNGALVWEAP